MGYYNSTPWAFVGEIAIVVENNTQNKYSVFYSFTDRNWSQFMVQQNHLFSFNILGAQEMY